MIFQEHSIKIACPTTFKPTFMNKHIHNSFKKKSEEEHKIADWIFHCYYYY